MTGSADLSAGVTTKRGCSRPAAPTVAKTYTVTPGKAYTVAEMNPAGV
jgi:hypothetical protein